MILVDTLSPYIKQYGYWAVFIIVFLESLGFPLPGETFIFAASICAMKGMIHPFGLIVLSIMATFLANLVSFRIGYQCGPEFLLKYGKYVFITKPRLDKAEKFLRKYGDSVVVIARFIIGLRQLNGFFMGAFKMPFLRYAFLNLIGAVLWVCCTVGVAFGLVQGIISLFFKHR